MLTAVPLVVSSDAAGAASAYSKPVAGYTIGHDVSARDWQLKKDGKQWMVGKTFDTFAPLGPTLVTADDENRQSLTLLPTGSVAI